MSAKKKAVRKAFRDAVFGRDGYSCVICGKAAASNIAEDVLDAHHIHPRAEMPNGGFVKENGVTLCKEKCHLLAEEYLQGINLNKDFSPDALYAKIGSSLKQAIAASKCLR